MHAPVPFVTGQRRRDVLLFCGLLMLITLSAIRLRDYCRAHRPQPPTPADTR